MGNLNTGAVQAAFVAEVTAGVTPATPVFTNFRATGETLDVARTFAFSNELNGKRGPATYAVPQAKGGGGLDFEYSNAVIDAFFESALRNAWATNVLTNGTTPKSFTVETKFEAGATDIFKRITGAEVNTLALDLKSGDPLTGSVGFMARGGDYADAIVTGATYSAAGTAPVLVGADVGAIAMAGLTVGCLSAATININNNLSEETCLGSLGPTGFAAGGLDVSGTISIIASDGEYDILRAGADGLSTSLSLEIGRTAGQKLRVELPVIVLTDMKLDAEDAETGTVLISASYRAIQAASLSGAVIRLTRNV